MRFITWSTFTNALIISTVAPVQALLVMVNPISGDFTLFPGDPLVIGLYVLKLN